MQDEPGEVGYFQHKMSLKELGCGGYHRSHATRYGRQAAGDD